MRIEARWQGNLSGFLKQLDGLKPESERALGRAVRRATTKTRGVIRKAAPRHAGPGKHRVAAGIKSKAYGTGIDTKGRVYAAGIAIPVLKGSRAHEIRPERRKALKIGDQFAASANHPGHAPNPFFDRGVEDAIPVIDEELGVVGQEVVRALQ